MTHSDEAPQTELQRFIQDLDRWLGGKPEEESEEILENFNQERQPQLHELLMAIAAEHGVPDYFLDEMVFHMYAMDKYLIDKLDLEPVPISKSALDSSIQQVEFVLNKKNIVEYHADLFVMITPFMQPMSLNSFLIIWEQDLNVMLEDGSISESLFFDLFRFYLVVLNAFQEQFFQTPLFPSSLTPN